MKVTSKDPLSKLISLRIECLRKEMKAWDELMDALEEVAGVQAKPPPPPAERN